jgi:uncharacterized membrane protein
MFQFRFLLSAIILIALDFLYLNITSSYFKGQIQRIQNNPLKVNILGVLLCYLFIITGINYFIIKPHKSPYDAFLLGIVIYGIYETTNYSLFQKWSIFTVILDTLWGGILFALSTYLTYLL